MRQGFPFLLQYGVVDVVSIAKSNHALFDDTNIVKNHQQLL